MRDANNSGRIFRTGIIQKVWKIHNQQLVLKLPEMSGKDRCRDQDKHENCGYGHKSDYLVKHELTGLLGN